MKRIALLMFVACSGPTRQGTTVYPALAQSETDASACQSNRTATDSCLKYGQFLKLPDHLLSVHIYSNAWANSENGMSCGGAVLISGGCECLDPSARMTRSAPTTDNAWSCSCSSGGSRVTAVCLQGVGAQTVDPEATFQDLP
jgi:hypothetical protein